MRFSAIQTLDALGAIAQVPAAVLGQLACSDGHSSVRQIMAEILCKLMKDQPAFVPYLASVLQEQDVEVRRRIIQALPDMPPDSSLEPALRQTVLSEDKAWVRHTTAKLLGQIQTPDAETIKAMGEALRDSDAAVRSLAAQNLGKWGPQARATSSSSASVLKDSNTRVRYDTAVALGEITEAGDGVVPALIGALHDEHSAGRLQAIQTLGRFGSKASPAFVELYACLQDENESVCAAAERVLPQVRPHASLWPLIVWVAATLVSAVVAKACLLAATAPAILLARMDALPLPKLRYVVTFFAAVAILPSVASAAFFGLAEVALVGGLGLAWLRRKG